MTSVFGISNIPEQSIPELLAAVVHLHRPWASLPIMGFIDSPNKITWD